MAFPQHNSSYWNATMSSNITDMKYYAFLYISPSVFLLHVCNIVLIICKKRFHTAGNWFLVSLSVGDTMVLILFLIRCQNAKVCQNPRNDLSAVIMWCYVASLFSTLGITLDRYVSVQYSLRYHSIVTGKSVAASIVSIWILTGLLEILVSVISSSTNEPMYLDLPNYVVILPCCLLLFVFALHIRHVRNKHETNITQRRRYFGVEAEQLHLLRRLQDSVSGILRLNITTAVVVFLTTVLTAIWKYGALKGDPWVLRVFGLSYVFHQISNPILYVLVTSSLRKEYKKIFCRRKNRVEALVGFQRSNENNRVREFQCMTRQTNSNEKNNSNP